MDLPVNHFKRALAARQPQLGLWCTLPGAYAVEIAAGAGFDWLLLDTEHSPGDPITVLPQLQAIAPYSTSAVVRPASNDPVLIKRFLDVGVQSLLVPYVQTVEEAQRAVLATRYPPHGVRGVSAATRATRFGRVPRYGQRAHEELCVLVQVETEEALGRLEDIASVEGVDGVFIGPGDLAATMGVVGELDHPRVVAAIEDALQRLAALGKPSGILTANATFAARCLTLGTAFTAVGVDTALLARSADALAQQFRATIATLPAR
ncbi:MAG: 4-hydroxy-2-oxo-heptane-1,7-dioate aldolase [Burkholderiales bacterium]|nr:4-hydroxy-2-oxo-heptane-1,7-dioate aldolase [Burkholderiales bacterium]